MTRKSNRRRARKRSTTTVAEVIELERQHQQQQQQQQQQHQRTVQKRDVPLVVVPIVALPSPNWLLQLELIIVTFLKFEKVVLLRVGLDRQFLEHLTDVRPVNFSQFVQLLDHCSEYLDERFDWEHRLLDEIVDYMPQLKNIDRFGFTEEGCNLEWPQYYEQKVKISQACLHVQELEEEKSKLFFDEFSEKIRKHMEQLNQCLQQVTWNNGEPNLVRELNLNRSFKQLHKRLEKLEIQLAEIMILQLQSNLIKNQDLLEEKLINIAVRKSSVMKRYTKFFRQSNGRIYIQIGGRCEMMDADRTVPIAEVPTTTGSTNCGSDRGTVMAVFGDDNDNDHAVQIENNTCSICFGTYQDGDRIIRNAIRVVKAKCNHMFHEECMTTWRQQESMIHHSNCPCCRRRFLINTV